MTMRTFIPPVMPNFGVDDDRQFEIHHIAFGDGYSQRAPQGLNNRASTVTLTWTLLLPAAADTICRFFDDHKGSAAFLWRLPDEPAARKWTVQRYRRTHSLATRRAVTATLTEVFDLE